MRTLSERGYRWGLGAVAVLHYKRWLAEKHVLGHHLDSSVKLRSVELIVAHKQ